MDVTHNFNSIFFFQQVQSASGALCASLSMCHLGAKPQKMHGGIISCNCSGSQKVTLGGWGVASWTTIFLSFLKTAFSSGSKKLMSQWREWKWNASLI